MAVRSQDLIFDFVGIRNLRSNGYTTKLWKVADNANKWMSFNKASLDTPDLEQPDDAVCVDVVMLSQQVRTMMCVCVCVSRPCDLFVYLSPT